MKFEQTKFNKYKEDYGSVRYFDSNNKNDLYIKQEYFRDKIKELEDFALTNTNWYDNVLNDDKLEDWEKEDFITDSILGELIENDIAEGMGYEDTEYAYEQMYGW